MAFYTTAGHSGTINLQIEVDNMKYNKQNKNKGKGSLPLSFILLSCFVSLNGLLSQKSEIKSKNSNPSIVHSYDSDSFLIKPFNLAVQAKFAFASEAQIQTFEGGYQLRSRPLPTFSGGVNYYLNASEKVSVNTGLHLDFIKTFLFIEIPGADLTSFYNKSNGTLIELKDLKFKISAPIQVNLQLINKKRSNWGISVGISLNCSGFSNDEIVICSIADSSFHLKDVLRAEVSSNNNKTIWPSYNIGIFRGFRLANLNSFQLGFFGEYSSTNFLKTDYSIEIPNKPYTKGTALLNGSRFGLSIQYGFTRQNSRIINYMER